MNSRAQHIIIGTAGHIDHGKSLLVKALTGTDPDRLEAEKKRGVTIDLGFAFISERIAIIDVPGHERFIKTMVAGTQTIDMVLFIVAADDSIMPQTREHFDILRLLNIQAGIIVITKCDLVSRQKVNSVKDDIRNLTRGSFLEQAPIQAVSALSGEGIEPLSALIQKTASEIPVRNDSRPFWMPVDRSFSIKGHGTVVTGSVLSGIIESGDVVELLPQSDKIRIRGIQVHGMPQLCAKSGDRAALNLAQIDYHKISRGNIISATGQAKPTFDMYVKINLLSRSPNLEQDQRLRIHLGTGEIMGRIRLLDVKECKAGSSCYACLHLEKPTSVRTGDRFIIRRYSPLTTLGGGHILDPEAGIKPESRETLITHLSYLDSGDPETVLSSLLATFNSMVTKAKLIRLSGLTSEDFDPAIQKLIQKKEIKVSGIQYIHKNHFNSKLDHIKREIQTFHRKHPHLPGMNTADLQCRMFKDQPELFNMIIQALKQQHFLVASDQYIKHTDHKIKLEERDQNLADQILTLLKRHPFRTPPEKIIAKELNTDTSRVYQLLKSLQSSEKIIQLEKGIYFHRDAVDKAREKLINRLYINKNISVSEFRDIIQSTRKYALALLEYFDQKGITERCGDVRILRDQYGK